MCRQRECPAKSIYPNIVRAYYFIVGNPEQVAFHDGRQGDLRIGLLPRFMIGPLTFFAGHPLQRPVLGIYKAHDCFQNRYAEPLGAGPLPCLEALFPTRKRLYSPGSFS